MDGNGRWARQRLLNRIKGHEKGAETVRAIVRASREVGIGVLTLYAFSTENWQRPKTEVNALMTLLKRFLQSEADEMLQNNIRLNTIGQTDRLPQSVRSELSRVMALTAGQDGMLLNLALSYGGRAEILRAVQLLARKVKTARLEPEDITDEVISDSLYTRGMPDPDLLIRTSGESRISNFLLWQIAYSEIYITRTFWPDFDKAEYLQILKAYQQRDRRFGRVND
jgi:undecaprenyl diphosphate synthase